jgi:hypothetical protein
MACRGAGCCAGGSCCSVFGADSPVRRRRDLESEMVRILDNMRGSALATPSMEDLGKLWDIFCLFFDKPAVCTGEKDAGGSGGLLEPPGPLL